MNKVRPKEGVTLIQGPHQVVFVARTSQITNRLHTMPIAGVTIGELEDYFRGKTKSRLIQHVFPTLTPTEREFLMTGITQEEWDKYIAVSEEEEE